MRVHDLDETAAPRLDDNLGAAISKSNLVAACAQRLELEVSYYFFFFFVAFLTAFFTAFLIAFFFAAMLCTSSLFDAARQINRRARAVSR
jgi:hypothetical protein